MELAQSVAAWVDRSRPVLDRHPFAQTDLDELLDVPVPHDAVVVAFECFRRLVVEVDRRVLDVDVLLTIPLPWSVGLTTDHPALDDLMRQSWDQVEVPGLYLLRRGHLDGYEAVEEYRIPIAITLDLPRRTVAYYRTFLSVAECGPDAEYPRVIYVRTVDSEDLATASDSR